MDIQVNKQQSIRRIQSIKNVQYQNLTNVITFNQTGSTIISAGRNIKVWSFLGCQKLLRKQKVYAQIISIQHSKKINWFAAGNKGCSIQCFMEKSNGEWRMNSIFEETHQQIALGLVLNKNEDQLLSFSFDGTIIAWKIDCQQNTLEYEYHFEKKHNSEILSINLNQSEIYLVSCDEDSRIILWNKENKWQFLRIITSDYYGMRAFFMSDYLITCIQLHRGQIYNFEIEKAELIHELSLNSSRYLFDFHNFPIIYNLAQSMNDECNDRFIYNVKKQVNGKVGCILDIIICDKHSWCTTLQNGKFIILKSLQQIKVYQISFY